VIPHAYRVLLRDRRARRLLSGLGVSSLGDGMSVVTIAWLAVRTAPPGELGLFVGSGVVEAGCKSIVGQRLKLSGMRWNIPGATGILTLRCQQAIDRFDQIWSQAHNQTATAATA